MNPETMPLSSSQEFITEFLYRAGIVVNGYGPADIRSFRARTNQLWQLVLSKNGLLEGYERPPSSDVQGFC